VRVRVGEYVQLDDRRLRVVAVSDTSVTLRDRDADSVREILIEELTRLPTLRFVADARLNSAGDDLVALQHLDESQRSEVWFWVTCMEELERAINMAGLAGTPRSAVYEQCAVELRAQGRQVEARTLRRKLTAFRVHGAAGLIDRRVATGSNEATRRTDQRVVAAIAEVMEAQANTSTGTRTRIVDGVRIILDERYEPGVVPLPSRATLFRVIAEMDRGRFVTGSARTRRSLANRPDRPFAAMGVSRPGEQVQIDSTKLDVFVQLPDGVRARPELTIMLDVATRSVISAVVRPVATKSIDLVVLLARTLVPYHRRPGGRVETRALVSGSFEGKPLMREGELDDYRRRVPYIFPDTITTDRGRIFISEHFRAVCHRLGISLNLSAPYTPTDKAKVERMFQSINTGFAQHLAGYTGRGVEFRGDDVDAGDLLSLPQLQELLDDWIVVEWQSPPRA
jgi:putative transposase